MAAVSPPLDEESRKRLVFHLRAALLRLRSERLTARYAGMVWTTSGVLAGGALAMWAGRLQPMAPVGFVLSLVGLIALLVGAAGALWLALLAGYYRLKLLLWADGGGGLARATDCRHGAVEVHAVRCLLLESDLTREPLCLVCPYYERRH